jgi:hypothetical protein
VTTERTHLTDHRLQTLAANGWDISLPFVSTMESDSVTFNTTAPGTEALCVRVCVRVQACVGERPAASKNEPIWSTSTKLCMNVMSLMNFQNFMEDVVSLPCSQEPNPGPYLAPDESSPYPHFLFLYSGLSLSDIPINTFVCPSLFFSVCCKSRPSHSPWFHRSNNIWWGAEVWSSLFCSAQFI